MKEFFSKHWQKFLYVVVAVVVLLLCFFRPLTFKCSADSMYTQYLPATSWGITANEKSELFGYLDFEGFDKYLSETLKIPAYSYGNFKFNLDIVVQVALYSAYQDFFESEWEKVKAGLLDRREVVKFGNFDIPEIVYDCEYLGLELSEYDGIKFVYHVSNNQKYQDSKNHNILNFKLSLNWGQTFNKEYKYIDIYDYPKIPITYNLTGVTGATTNPTSIYQNDKDTQLSFTLKDGYSWEDSTVTVTGATYYFNQETGTLTLFVVKGDSITVTVTATAVQTGETWVLKTEINDSTDFSADILFNSNFIDFNKISLNSMMGILGYTKVGATSATVAYKGGWKNEAYRTITFQTSPTGDLLTWLQANGTKQGSAARSPMRVGEIQGPNTGTTPTGENQIAAYRDNNYIIDMHLSFPSISNKYVSYEEYPLGFRISSLEASYSGASRPLWTLPASGTAPNAYMNTLNTMMSYLQFYGRNVPSTGSLAWTRNFVSGDTVLYDTVYQNIGSGSGLLSTFRIRSDMFDGTTKSFSLYSYKIYLVGDGKESYGSYYETIPGYGKYELFNYYKEAVGIADNCDDYIYNSEFYPMITDNFGASFGGGTGSVAGYDYNTFYMPLDDFNFFDLFKGSTWYAIINNSVVWLCCEMPLLSNLTKPLYTAARLSSNYLAQYIIPFFTSTGLIGAAVGFIILISNLWRWIRRDE